MDEKNEWNWDGNEPSVRAQKKSKDSISFGDYVWIVYPDKKNGDLKLAKKSRDHLKTTFTDKGSRGEGLIPYFELLQKELRLEVEEKYQEFLEGSGLTGRKSYFILPGFFEFLIKAKELNLDFALQFRTFGNDIEEIAKEFNAFCEGRHPVYPGHKFDGSDGKPDYRINLTPGSDSFGLFYRNNQGAYLILNTKSMPKDDQDFSKNYYTTGQYLIFEGITNIYEYMKSRLTFKNRTIFLQDYYDFWRSNLEDPMAGKLIPLEPGKTPKLKVLFFDDNIENDDAHIVDARHFQTALPLKFSETK